MKKWKKCEACMWIPETAIGMPCPYIHNIDLRNCPHRRGLENRKDESDKAEITEIVVHGESTNTIIYSEKEKI